MPKVKAFFSLFLDSLLPHYPFYHTLLRSSFVASFRYFIVLNIAVYAFFLILFGVKVYSAISLPRITQNFMESLRNYPNDLVIRVQNNTLTTNYNRPYFMWMNYQDQKILLFVVDPTATEKKFEMYNPIVLLAGQTISVRDFSNPSIHHTSSYQSTTATVTKTIMRELEQYLAQLIQWSGVILSVLFLIIVPILVVVTNLWYVAIASLVAYFIFKHKHKQLTYKKTLQMSFHAITLPLLVNYSLGLFTSRTDIFPFGFLILLLLFVGVAVYEAHWK